MKSESNTPRIIVLFGLILAAITIGAWWQNPRTFQITWNRIRPGAWIVHQAPYDPPPIPIVENPPGQDKGPPIDPPKPDDHPEVPKDPGIPPSPPEPPPDQVKGKEEFQPAPTPVVPTMDQRELALGIHTRGLNSDIRDSLFQLVRNGARIRDLEFCGDGMVALYGTNQHLAYKMTDVDNVLTGLEKQFPKDPIRRFRCGGDGSYIILFGENGWRSAGLSDAILQKLKEFNTQAERFSDIALFGKDSAALIRGDNGYWAHNVPQGWIDSLEKIHTNNWKISQVMEGAGDNHETAFVVLIGNNGYSWNNAPDELVAEWKKLFEAKRGIQCVAMKGASWVLLEAQ